MSSHLRLPTPAGTIAVGWNEQGLLTSLDWVDHSPSRHVGGWTVLSKCEIPWIMIGLLERLRAYFEKGEPIGDLLWDRIDQTGWSEFQIQVYRATTQIPHGETRTYSWVASKIRNVPATRAVGQALRKNPLPVLIPCHRVVSSNTLGGFMGVVDPTLPEIQLKRRLIEIEERYRSPVFSFFLPAFS